MELLQLRYFCDAAVTQNFSRTAEKFHVPPSNISQCIKRLETELGTPLFRRSANRVVLSEDGQRFYEDIRRALQLVDNAVRNVASADKAGVIRVGMCINRRIVMQTIEKFRKLHSNVNVITQYEWPQGDTELDIVVTDGTRESAAYTKEKVSSEQLLLATKQGLFPPDVTVSAELLREQPFVLLNDGSSLYNLTYTICREMGFEPRVALQSEDPFYIRKCVELGLGVTIAPSVSWHGQFAPDVRLHPLGDHTRDIYVHRRKQTAPRYLDEFYRMLVSEFQAMTDR